MNESINPLSQETLIHELQNTPKQDDAINELKTI